MYKKTMSCTRKELDQDDQGKPFFHKHRWTKHEVLITEKHVKSKPRDKSPLSREVVLVI